MSDASPDFWLFEGPLVTRELPKTMTFTVSGDAAAAFIADLFDVPREMVLSIPPNIVRGEN